RAGIHARAGDQQYRAGGEPFTGGLLPAFRAGTPGAHDRNRAGQQAGHQPQMSLGAPSTPGHPTQEDHQLSPPSVTPSVTAQTVTFAPPPVTLSRGER